MYPLYLLGFSMEMMVVRILEPPVDRVRYAATLVLNVFMLPFPVAMIVGAGFLGLVAIGPTSTVGMDGSQ